MNRRILLIVLALVAAAIIAAVALILNRTPGKPGVDMLDGPGSYIEHLEGTVVRISNANDYDVAVTVAVDEEFHELCFCGNCEAVISRSKLEKNDVAVGDHVIVWYPGGYTYTGDPMLIYNTHNITKTHTGEVAE